MTAQRDSEKSDAWFEYVVAGSRFSAWPIRWQGWLAFVVLLVGPLTAMMVLIKALPQVPSAVFGLGAMALVFGTLFPLAYFKGRRRR